MEQADIVRALQAQVTPDLALENVPNLLVSLMQIVQAGRNLRGPEKKELVLQVLTAVLQDAPYGEVARQLLPAMIETFLQVDNGKLVIKPPPSSFSWCRCL